MPISIRPMEAADLAEAGRIFRVAFGTFLNFPDPENFAADRDFISARRAANPEGALVAELDGAVVGSNIATNWGSFGFFGPLTIRPDFWNQRVAQQLLAPTMELFDRWGVRETGLYTFSHSAKHSALYQKFGFWPRFLTAVMSKPVAAQDAPYLRYSTLSADAQEQALAACRELTSGIHDGLDVSVEIRSVEDHNLGDTLLLWGGDSLEAFAVCHVGEGTEAGKGACYLKFAAAGSENAFDRLLDACDSFAAARDAQKLDAGVNLGRSEAYRSMLRRGFRTQIQGVAMHKPDAPGFNRRGVWILDDWR